MFYRSAMTAKDYEVYQGNSASRRNPPEQSNSGSLEAAVGVTFLAMSRSTSSFLSFCVSSEVYSSFP